MSKLSERVAAALAQLPEDVQESAVSFFFDEADKLAALKREIAVGIADIEAGRVVSYDPKEFRDRIDAIAKAKGER